MAGGDGPVAVAATYKGAMARVSDASAAGTPIGRRVFLGVLGFGYAGILWGAGASDELSKLLRPVTERDPLGITALLPSSGTFRFYSVVGFAPTRSEADYRLAVSGMVDRPLSLGIDDLKAMPRARLVRDFQCVTGWRVPSVAWTGVRLADVLDAAGVGAGAQAITFKSFDGVYRESLTLAQARRPDVLVAYQMDDKPITQAHGGPVRMYVAPMYGYKSTKWLGEVSVVDRVETGYWERRGYDTDAFIGRSNGRDDKPV
jgi:DMSO/TMAO reductase YedYZ molybdopterin-dependent catalytic subunit